MKKPVKILFVCTANRMRSRTAEELYRGDTRFSVKSAGTSIFAQVIINEDLVEWADHIVVMERHHEDKIRKKFSAEGQDENSLSGYSRHLLLYGQDSHESYQREI